ncbi:unnamed protein product [Ilex paraguariensis]|uniref:DNA primase large subunit C-terminal domain-containing protein n=1 Tax=Ilex paraguariensis TaxID=185542 RepID=A0ABC8RNV3_9AQUA
MAVIDPTNVQPSELLVDMDNQTLKAKEKALSRKEILDKMEKLLSACEEESWPEDNRASYLCFLNMYHNPHALMKQDENKYNVSSGAHLNLQWAKKDYTPYSCQKIISSTPSVGDHHGCPYRHFRSR